MNRVVLCCLASALMFCSSTVRADPLLDFGPSQKVGDAGTWPYLAPVMAEMPNGSIGISWLEEIDRVYFASTADGGASWSSTSQINDTNAGDRYHQRLWVDPDGYGHDATAFFGEGTAGSPLEEELDVGGTFYFCEGTYYLNLEVTESTDLVGMYGASETTLSGAGLGTVLPSVGVLTVSGLVMLAAGAGLLGRRVRRGATA